jgi:hypothetical protein
MGEEHPKKEKVNVNSRDVIQEDSKGQTVAFPDVCETPSPAGPIPIPYPNIAQSSDTSKGTKKVKMDGKEVMLKDSSFSKSTGDEPSHSSEMGHIDHEKSAQEGVMKRLMTVKKLGIPLWLWGLIGVGGLLILWLISSKIMPPIEPYDAPLS